MPESIVRILPDPRADGAVREVVISKRAVTICRRFRGIIMRLVVPCANYRGLTLRPAGTGMDARLAITLLHTDPDFDVALADADTALAAGQAMNTWAQYLGVPQLCETKLSVNLSQSVHKTRPRRRSALLKLRRRHNFLRRKMALGPIVVSC